ncbi:hypothetical protein HC031_02495 [Planosporangium thailandense]|uniref:Uncharacterized protein n=1 Tax=Planosporangium thailandense TaxID=765197 RepID=A0ABX0XS41_9ACTN|nr:hypothetical protein [Planosporangium thailandense]NJC68598.1 hypothetical protein [Planosporangium thailandense]
MTADYGSVEPVDASELATQHDEIEHWLHGIRNELTDNPSDWLATADTSGDAQATSGESDAEVPSDPPQEERVGRHRAED